LAKSLNDCGRRAVTLLNYTLAFALQLRKRTDNLSQGRNSASFRSRSSYNAPEHVVTLFHCEARRLSIPSQSKRDCSTCRFPVIGTTEFKMHPLGTGGRVKRLLKTKLNSSSEMKLFDVESFCKQINTTFSVPGGRGSLRLARSIAAYCDMWDTDLSSRPRVKCKDV
jgi:hypothetical protein